MRRDVWVPLVLWIVVTLASIGIAAFLMDPFPTQGAEEARLSDDALIAMTFLGAAAPRVRGMAPDNRESRSRTVAQVGC